MHHRLHVEITGQPWLMVFKFQLIRNSLLFYCCINQISQSRNSRKYLHLEFSFCIAQEYWTYSCVLTNCGLLCVFGRDKHWYKLLHSKHVYSLSHTHRAQNLGINSTILNQKLVVYDTTQLLSTCQQRRFKVQNKMICPYKNCS